TNLSSFGQLAIVDADGSDPISAAAAVRQAVASVRRGAGPALLHVTVPRLSGHSGQDTQTYKSPEVLSAERSRDPLACLHEQLVPAVMSDDLWERIETQARRDVLDALARVERRSRPQASRATRFVFSERLADGTLDLQCQGGTRPECIEPPAGTATASGEGPRINMVTAIRRTLEHELAVNSRVLIFGEDIGPKGGVHAVTLGLQEKFGDTRVFDTSLSEEGIIGRAVGMAIAGLMPVPEIQFRKYADPATEQLNDCGTMRWLTNNRFAAPMVVRMPIGFFKCGDPWHSQTNEVQFVHSPGWKVAAPSNAEDAVGLLRASLRGNDPVIFFEHRAMLDATSARRPYPGDDYVLEFGKARVVREGSDLTIVTWGAMVERCEQAAEGRSVDILDLRTLMPWDREAVLASVKRTRRCLIVHEDLISAGFGAEVAAVVAETCFLDLDAPVSRLAMPDIPSPHNPALMEWALPSVDGSAHSIAELVG